MLIVRSPVRISFAGGGTDLPAYFEKFDGAVLSTTINKYFYTVLQPRRDGKIQIISSDLRVVETWPDISEMTMSGTDLEIPLAVLKYLRTNVSVNLFLASEIPPGTGLGSSASVCVNVLKMMTTYLQLPMSKHELAARAYHIAHNVLGKSVGKQDEYASAFGGLNLITFRSNGSVQVDPINVDPGVLRELENNLMLFFTGTAHHSWTILQEQEKSTRNEKGVAIDSLHAIRAMTERMRRVIISGDLDDFGTLLHEGWEFKKKVASGISNARIDEVYHLARQNGAIGGKITGAGGGGFLLLYCPQTHQAKVRHALTNWGAREMEFSFDLNGAQVIVNDPYIDRDERSGMRWTFRPVPAMPLSKLPAILKHHPG
jgi:D-glycero-alpha-D-manno-heptose-7-phosphate kinase